MKANRRKIAPLRLGFQDDGQFKSGNLATLGAGRELGARSVRVIVPARDIKQGQGQYDFSGYDRVVNAALAQGIKPQLVLDTARDFGGGDPTQYARFVRAAGRHFKGRVERYSLINEPDLRMRPAKYRELYQRGRRGLKAVDPNAQVLFGEFSAHDPIGYAKKVIGKGGVRAEGFAFHPYQFKSDPLAPGDLKGGIGRLGRISRDVSHLGLRTGMGKAPGVFLTEFGYRTRGDEGVSDAQAAAWWPRAIRKAEGAGVRQIVAYTMSAEQNPNSAWDSSLLNPDGTPRPAFAAVQQAMALRHGRRG